MAEVIRFPRAESRAAAPSAEPDAIAALAARLAQRRPDLSHEACTTWARRVASVPPPAAPAPTIAPDDPLFALFDAFKRAEAAYREALQERAERHGLPTQNVAARMRAVRRADKRHRAASGELFDLPDGVLPI